MIKLIGLFIILPLFIWGFFFAPPAGTVNREDFGDAWPLTVENGVLECVGNKQVIFRVEGKEYALNGNADAAGYKDVQPIWKDAPGGMAKKNIGVLIDAGLKRC